MKKIDFIELIKQQKESNIPWCNMTCRIASINAEGRYYWNGTYGNFHKVIAKKKEPELMFECLYISRNKRIKEIEAMGYSIEQACEAWNGNPEPWDKVYFIAVDRKGVKISPSASGKRRAKEYKMKYQELPLWAKKEVYQTVTKWYINNGVAEYGKFDLAVCVNGYINEQDFRIKYDEYGENPVVEW